MIKQLLNSAFVGYEEFCRSRRVLSTSASVDNTLLALHNSSYPTQPHSLIAKLSICEQTDDFENHATCQRARADNSTICYRKNKLMSVCNASVVLLTMNFVITLG